MRAEAEEGQAEVARASRGKGLGGEKKRVKRQKGYICCEGGKRGERNGHCFCKWMLLLLLGFLCFQLCTMPCFCLFCSLCSRFFVAFYFSCLEIIAAFMEWSTVVKSLLQLRKVGKNKGPGCHISTPDLTLAVDASEGSPGGEGGGRGGRWRDFAEVEGLKVEKGRGQ